MQTVVQRIRKTRSPQPGATFTREVWVGTIGGAALSADPAPNTTPPSAGRIARASVAPGIVAAGGYGICPTQAIGGTACTVQYWFFDDTQALWVPYIQPQTITVATSPQAFVNLLGLEGAQVFVQLTANTGVQVLGYGFF
jgi:hypothetical protein